MHTVTHPIKHILLVEDDLDFGNILKQYLQMHQMDCQWVTSANEALKLLKTSMYDLCILDVMLPDMDGFSLAKKIQELQLDSPFLFLTAKGSTEDKINGLKLGADDYIVKPFDAEELLLRMHNIWKRTENYALKETTLQFSLNTFNPKTFYLETASNKIRLTDKEAGLLQLLLEHKNQIIKREHILNAIWGNDDFFSGRSMDVYISRLRKYLKEDRAISIKTIRKVGFEFNIN